jgi:hypothetical protein
VLLAVDLGAERFDFEWPAARRKGFGEEEKRSRAQMGWRVRLKFFRDPALSFHPCLRSERHGLGGVGGHAVLHGGTACMCVCVCLAGRAIPLQR